MLQRDISTENKETRKILGVMTMLAVIYKAAIYFLLINSLCLYSACEQRKSPEKAIPEQTKAIEPLPNNGERFSIKNFSVLSPAAKQWSMTGKGSTMTGESSINFERDTGYKYHEVKARVVSLPAVNISDEKALMTWVKQREAIEYRPKNTLDYRLWELAIKSATRLAGTRKQEIIRDTSLGRECVRITRTGFSGTLKPSSHLYPPERREEIRAMERGNDYSFVSYYCLTPSPNAVIKLHYYQRTPVGMKPVDLESEVAQMLKSLRFDTEKDVQ
jgi:hypothetical protein